MIKYFRRIGLVRVTELGVGLLIISLALILMTGGAVFAMGDHINLANIEVDEAKKGMNVELDITEILNVYADADEEKGSYYIIPYPITEETKEQQITLMAVYIPEEYREEADMIMTATANHTEYGKKIALNGELQEMSPDEKKLFLETAKEAKNDYGLSEAQILELCFIPLQVNALDYVVTIFAAVIIVWFIGMLIYILSNKNQEHVTKFIDENDIDVAEFQKEMETAKTFGKILFSENYVAFLMWYRVFVVKKSEIDSIVQIEKPNKDADGPDTIKENAIMIHLKNNVQYRILLKAKNLEKVLELVNE